VPRQVLAAVVILGVGPILGSRPAGDLIGVVAGIGLLVVFSFALFWVWTMSGLILCNEKSVMGSACWLLFPLTFLSNAFVMPDTTPDRLPAFVNVNPITGWSRPSGRSWLARRWRPLCCGRSSGVRRSWRCSAH
jgi:ABC-2 type transport system permease protein